MAIAGLGTFQSKSFYYKGYKGSKEGDGFPGTAIKEGANELLTEKSTHMVQSAETQLELDGGVTRIPVTKKSYGEVGAYTRMISANVKTTEMLAQANSDGEVVFSYKETEISFNVLINSDGKDKTYTIQGIDEHGQEFEKAFNPYSANLEELDYPEFAALCMYIRQTDEVADLISGKVFTDTSYFDGIFERGNRVELLKEAAQENSALDPIKAKLAEDLYNSICDFYQEIMKGIKLDDDLLSLLFEEQEEVEGVEKPDVSETVVSKHDEVTNPANGRKVPIDIQFITSYTDKGINCRERKNVGGKESERELWSIPYAKEKSYEKIQNFLKSFSENQRLTFSTQEEFWKDFMKDDFDIAAFRSYYESTDNGRIDLEKAIAEGKRLRDALSEPFAKYLNNAHFIGRVYTEKEMMEYVDQQIQNNQNKLKMEADIQRVPIQEKLENSQNGKKKKRVV